MIITIGFLNISSKLCTKVGMHFAQKITLFFRVKDLICIVHVKEV